MHTVAHLAASCGRTLPNWVVAKELWKTGMKLVDRNEKRAPNAGALRFDFCFYG